MTITFTNGSTTSTSSEASIWDNTADRHYSGWIFTHNMTAAETIVIKVYVYDQNAATYRVWNTATLSGVQSDPAFFIPFVPTKRHKVTIQRTGGSDKAYTWQRNEVE